MEEKGSLDTLIGYGERIRKAFTPAPKPEAMSKTTEKAVEKAIGPRFRDTTVKAVSEPPAEAPKKPAPKKRKRKGPSKY